MKSHCLALCLLASACSTFPPPHREAPEAPVATYHQHLASPAVGELMGMPGVSFDADTLVQQLDDAGIRRGVVLSVAYMFGDDRRRVENSEAMTRAENDWTSAQVSRWPDRLVGFCSANPLRPDALNELQRCSRLPHMIGVKLHFGNSGVSLRNPEHLARIQDVVRFANERRLPIVVHFRAREGTPFGREDANLFMDSILPLARRSVVQVAHMAGAGGYPDYADEAMSVFADAIRANDPRTRSLYFDLTTVVTAETTPEEGARIAGRLREIGLDRTLFGADLSFGGNPAPRESWEIFRQRTPLSAAELGDIADNVAPYLR